MYGIIFIYRESGVICMNDRKRSEIDDFWAIEKLVPKKDKPFMSRPVFDTSAVDVDLPRPDTKGSQKASAFKLTPTPPPTPELIYSPVSPLIEQVKVFRWGNNYNYYEDFRRDALRLLRAPSHECPHVPFFSYVPQYVQLSREQLSWYLFWRDRIRHGEYLATDYSYIVLLIFEIINLGADADTVLGQRLLCELQRHYRREYPRLDRYLCEWICDYSLIHRLPPPLDFCEQGLADNSSLREFYVYFEGAEASDEYARLLIRFCSSYDYRKSKFATPENLPLYDKHVPAALSAAIALCSDSGRLLSGAGLENNTLTRDAYTGALCSSTQKRRFEISFFSFSRSHELRFVIADIIKYSENKIRARLGIKSRLSVFGLSRPITSALDDYFNSALPVVVRTVSNELASDAEYAKLYDLPKSELSLQNADLIEHNSWETTRLLIDAFDGEESKNPSCVEPAFEPTAVPNESDANPTDLLKARLGERFAFVCAAKRGDVDAQRKLALRMNLLPDALADSINEIAVDVLGDIILESSGDGYTIIENYMELFEND